MSVELSAMLAVQASGIGGSTRPIPALRINSESRLRDTPIIRTPKRCERSLSILAVTGTLAHQATLTAERLAEAEARDLARLERFGHLEDTVKRLEARLNRPQRRPWWRFWR